MSDPLSTIRALQSLTTELIERTQDRKVATELRDVQRMVASLQTEYFALKQSQLEVETENGNLKNRIAAFEQATADGQKQNLESGCSKETQ